MIKSPFIILFFSILFINAGFSQSDEMKNKDIRKLSKIHLFRGDKAYPESFLKAVRNDSLLLYTSLYHKDSGLFFTDAIVDFNNFDRATIINKKKRIRNTVLASASMGLASFFITKHLTKADPSRAFISPGTDPRVNRPLNSGNTEGVLAGVIGAGVGLIIGEKFFKTRIDLRKDRRKAKRLIKSHVKRK